MESKKYLETIEQMVDSAVSSLGKELQEYERSVLKQSEKELLLLLEIESSGATYHCSECGTEVNPNFPTPIAFCSMCQTENTWVKRNHWEETITFEQLTKLTFDKAHTLINKMSLKKRITILKELDHKLLYLYESTKAYTDRMSGKSMSPKVFISIMGKIKHLEILQAWLYGIE